MISRAEAVRCAKRILDETDKAADKLIVAEAFLELLNDKLTKRRKGMDKIDLVRLQSRVYSDEAIAMYERALKRAHSIQPPSPHVLILERALTEARRENDRLKTLYGSAAWEKEGKK